jgi:hypothetical protein
MARTGDLFLSEQEAKDEQRRRFADAASQLRAQVADLNRAIETLDGDAAARVEAADAAGPAATSLDLAPVAAIGERIRTEDNRATSHPIFLVESRDRIYGIGIDYATQFAWIDEDGREADPELSAAHEDNHRAGRDGKGMKEYARVGYVDRWKFATACLTEDGAKAYIAANGHNLKSPRIYVASAYRNMEWQAVRAFLLSLAGPKDEARP